MENAGTVPLETFDDIVIGGGKGGKSLALTFGSAGRKMALVERGQIGSAKGASVRS